MAPPVSQVIAKAYPEEAVGVFCSTGCVEESRLRVVEYSELPAALAQQRAPSGALAFNAANVALHYFSLPFLEACCADAHGAGVLRHHAALKKVACLGPLDAVAQQPAQPNALKLEAFIFDVYPLAPPGDVALLEGVRDEDFAPVKNAPGHAKDSPVRFSASCHVKSVVDVADGAVRRTLRERLCARSTVAGRWRRARRLSAMGCWSSRHCSAMAERG